MFPARLRCQAENLDMQLKTLCSSLSSQVSQTSALFQKLQGVDFWADNQDLLSLIFVWQQDRVPLDQRLDRHSLGQKIWFTFIRRLSLAPHYLLANKLGLSYGLEILNLWVQVVDDVLWGLVPLTPIATPAPLQPDLVFAPVIQPSTSALSSDTLPARRTDSFVNRAPQPRTRFVPSPTSTEERESRFSSRTKMLAPKIPRKKFSFTLNKKPKETTQPQEEDSTSEEEKSEPSEQSDY